MSLFSFGRDSSRYGAIIDIGSGSVLIAIVHSEPNKKHPKIIWSHREHAPLRNIDSLEQSAKAVMTSLVNTSMLLDGEGRRALFEYNPTAKISELHCNISAPWSYTVTKTINYKQEQPFDITEDLIEELLTSIERKIDEELERNDTLQPLGLQVITRKLLQIAANGYQSADPIGSSVNAITVSQSSAVTQEYLIETLTDIQEKIFPEVPMYKLSFILLLYATLKDLKISKDDVCLIDITYEATEIGVVRDGVLTYCTHTPFGSFSLAREIAAVLEVPLHEAFGYLHTDKPYAFMKDLPATKRKELETIFEAYIDRLTQLFHETGDALSIPKYLYLHCDTKSENIFIDLIQKASKRTIKTEPFLLTMSEMVIKKAYTDEDQTDITTPAPTDTALLLSAMFFHKQPEHDSFKYL